MKHNQETFPILQEADSVCTALFVYNRHSSLRTKSLQNAQSMLGLPVRELVQPSATRWLSHIRCYSYMESRYAAVVSSLSDLAEGGDVEAKGLLLPWLKGFSPKWVL